MARSAQASAASAEEINWLNPDTGTAGLRDKFEGTIARAVYDRWDFNGHAKPSQHGNRMVSGVKMALHLTLTDIDDGGKDEEVYWPAGAVEDFVPSDDGLSFEAITGRTGFAKDSELLQGMQYVVDSGAIAKSDLGVDPSVLEGKRFFWERKPALWAKPQEGKRAPDNPMPVKFIEDVIAGGSGKKKGASGGAAGKSAAASSKQGGKDAAAADEGGDDEISTLGLKFVLEVLEDLPPKQKTISREELGSEVITLLMTNKKYKAEVDSKTRRAIGALFDDNEFLEENSGKKTYLYDADDGEVTRI